MLESPGFAGLYHALSPDAQAAALVYGVVDAHVRTTWQVAQILRHADIQSRGRRLADTRLRDAARELVKHGPSVQNDIDCGPVVESRTGVRLRRRRLPA